MFRGESDAMCDTFVLLFFHFFSGLGILVRKRYHGEFLPGEVGRGIR